jgi:hypothetical protein
VLLLLLLMLLALLAFLAAVFLVAFASVLFLKNVAVVIPAVGSFFLAPQQRRLTRVLKNK